MILCKTPGEIEIMRKAEHLSNISRAIQKDVEANHFSIIREYGGYDAVRSFWAFNIIH